MDCSPSTIQARTFCRLCEPSCGLMVTLEDGSITRVRPDAAHPVTAGFACSKGLRSIEVHHDSDRLDHPLRRTATAFARVSWTAALASIGARLDEVVRRHGPRAVALYVGNPVAFNYKAGVALRGFLRAIGSDRFFAAGSQDCNNKYAVSELLYGAARVQPIPDFDSTSHLLLIGTNPRISKMSFVSVPNPHKVLTDIAARGGTVRFVNPRRVDDRIGETIQIRPDTDAYLLAAMLHRIEETVGFSPRAFGRADGLERVVDFVRNWPASRVAPVCDVPEAAIATMADEFAAAQGAAVHSSVGVNQGRQGSLTFWLQQMLLLVTDNLDSPGGNIVAAGFRSPSPPVDQFSPYLDSPVGRFRAPAGIWPAALLPDLIEDREEPVRALIVCAGNPLLTVPGERAIRGALEGLDLLVSIDLYRNATAELADYVLPAADQFERSDVNSFGQGLQPRPWMQWTDALVEPAAERRTEDRILADLLDAMDGAERADDLPLAEALLDETLRANGRSLEELCTEQVLLGPVGADDRLRAELRTPSGRIRCVADEFEPVLERSEAIFDELSRVRKMQLVNLRTPSTLNTSLANVASSRQRAGTAAVGGNPVHLSAADAARLDVRDGDRVVLTTDAGQVAAAAVIDPTLRTGVVAMNHGWGHADAPGQTRAVSDPGVNVNRLTGTGMHNIDPFSGMSHLTGVDVDVRRCREAGGVDVELVVPP